MKGKRNIKVVCIYVRVSTFEQAREGYSISEQIKRLTKYCEAHGWVIFKIYVDAGLSGTNTDRPQLQEMLTAIQEHDIDAVLVFKLDRLSRSQRDTLELIDTFLEHGTDFVSMSESFDTSTPYGRAMIAILATFAQLERDTFMERVKVGKAGRAEDGKFHGSSYVPTGYKYVDGELVVDEFTAMQVREIFKLFNKRVPVNTICRRLNNAGLTHRSEWEPNAMKYVLKNKTYLGYIKHLDTYHLGNHTPLIDEETFNTAQRLMEERDNDELAKKSFAHTTYLAGLIWCGNCGARYAKRSAHPKKDGTRNSKYTCYSRSKQNLNQIRDPQCMNDSILVTELDEFVFNEIKKLKTDPSYIASIHDAKVAEDNGEHIAILEEQVKEITQRMSRLADLYSVGSMDMNTVKDKVEALGQTKKKLLYEIAELKGIPTITESEAIKLASTFEDVLQHGTFEDIRFVVSELIEKIVIVDKDNVKIYWTF